METNPLIKDTGLFIGQQIFEFSLKESFETITNLYQTIQQYREFTNPDDADAWFDYVHQIFHIMGFSTVKVAPRLFSVQDMGESKTPKALVCIIGPHENFEQIIYGLEWESYLFFAARYFQTEWVILTNGLQFKVLNYSSDADKQKSFQCEFDEIIKSGKTDNFFTIYKIFSIINWGKGVKPAVNQVDQDKTKTTGKRELVERHFIRKDFWTQLIALSKSKTNLLAKKSPIIGSYLNVGSGKSGLVYVFTISRENVCVELYIDNRDIHWNKQTFDTLSNWKKEIEGSFGNPLTWDRLEDNRASVIRYAIKDGGYKDKESWPQLQEKMIVTMLELRKAFEPYINQIR